MLVGSVPLKDAEAVFRALSERVGAQAARYPDGRNGARTNWIRWQRHIFEHNPAFELVTANTGSPDKLARPFYRLRPGTGDDIVACKPAWICR